MHYLNEGDPLHAGRTIVSHIAGGLNRLRQEPLIQIVEDGGFGDAGGLDQVCILRAAGPEAWLRLDFSIFPAI